MSFFLVLSAALIAQASAYTAAALADQITNLPGAEGLNLTFNQFSGYLAIPGAQGNSKNVHYWLVESMSSPASDPLSFWTNGGPGCSGLIGFFTEMGPFRPNADLTLSLNEYAWNSVSNMVFIESPVGVGFSYSDSKADYTNDDAGTAVDNYNLIQAFLTRFPEFSSNDLYITSESYGGHYLPTLAKQIVDQNKAGSNPIVNFKGFAVGNPYTNVYSGTPAMVDTYWGHQLISKPTYDNYVKTCITPTNPPKAKCLSLQNSLLDSVGNLNPYALDYPVCLTSSSQSKFGRAQRLWFLNHQLSAAGYTDEEKKTIIGSTDDYQPCEDNYSDAYLRQASVQAAIHVKTDPKWQECSYTLSYSYADSSVSTAPIYNYLIDGGFGLNILVYSGDDDAICATIGTQDWIWGLGYKITSEWQSYIVSGQTAGYLTKWSGSKLAFLTVHGAGHEVPTYKPEVALSLYKSYLKGDFTK
jgi:carboxypeptidase C (cathepsin A)